MAEQLIYLSILIPALSVLAILCLDKHPGLRDLVSITSSIILFVIIFNLYLTTDLDLTSQFILLEPIAGLTISFHIEVLGLLFSLIASSLWLITNIYSIGYMRANKEKNQTRFYSFFALSIAATMAIAFSANMFTLFLFYELLTLLTYPLVTHSGTKEARLKGRNYLGILLATSIGFQLTAIILIWTVSKDLGFQQHGVFQGHDSVIPIGIIYILFLFGVGKAALMPFHRWLPSAMVAPTPVSALLHAVAVVKAGVFTIVKASVYLFGLDTLQNLDISEYLYLLPGFTIITASIIALKQDNLKSRLAYSTISQLSYVILAVMVLTPLSIIAAGLHILAHAFGKITLFFVAGAIYTNTKKTNVSQLNGIGRTMPITMAAFLIGSLSMIGVPPTIGFLSKWFMLDSATLENNWGVIFVIVISTLLNAAYYLPITYKAFFNKPDEILNIGIKESPAMILLPIIFVATMTILLFFFPENVLHLLNQINN